jgi:predicted RNA-binding protein YlxR (DUF448 family)
MTTAAAMIQPPALTDDGEGASTRRCIVSGSVAEREGLIRFAVGPNGEVVADLAEKLPGRGFWVTAEADMLALADARVFGRAARASVTVPANLIAQIESGLARRIADYLGIAKRAGALVAGYEKSRAALKAGEAKLLIAAQDGAADGRAKLSALAPELQEMVALSAAEIGAALGREAAVHVVVTDARLAKVIGREGARLASVRCPVEQIPNQKLSAKVDQA